MNASSLPLPRLQHQSLRPVLPVGPLFLLLQHPEGLAGEVLGGLGGEQVRALRGGILPRVEDVRRLPRPVWEVDALLL